MRCDIKISFYCFNFFYMRHHRDDRFCKYFFFTKKPEYKEFYDNVYFLRIYTKKYHKYFVLLMFIFKEIVS